MRDRKQIEELKDLPSKTINYGLTLFEQTAIELLLEIRDLLEKKPSGSGSNYSPTPHAKGFGSGANNL